MNNEYFSLRNVALENYKNFSIPPYITNLLLDKHARILDFGCGFGQLIEALHQQGFVDVMGVDVNSEVLKHLQEKGANVHTLTEDSNFFELYDESFDFIIMSHVLEHIPKAEIIIILAKIRRLLRPDGRLLVMVPNAQSNTGSYWAYEDFTHTTLFTSGSLSYVLRAAGFMDFIFVDSDCTAGMRTHKAFFKRFFLNLYQFNKYFWNKVTSSAFHEPSPKIFSYEIKALAKK